METSFNSVSQTLGRSIRFGLIITFLLFFFSCGDDDENCQIILPSVEPVAVNDVTAASATLTSSADAGTACGSISERGFIWSESPDPTLQDGNVIVSGSGNGEFTAEVTGLSPNSFYYVRAYATNGQGTEYSNTTGINTTLLQSNPDGDGNTYGLVTIGNQVWFESNLKTTTDINGQPIAYASNEEEWLALEGGPGFVYYNFDEDMKSEYGPLYNGYVSQELEVCPEGSRIPTVADWDELVNYLGGLEVAGGFMKSESLLYWESPNEVLANSNAFNGRGSGFVSLNGDFVFFKETATWAASDENGPYYISINNASTEASIAIGGLNAAGCFRCIQE